MLAGYGGHPTGAARHDSGAALQAARRFASCHVPLSIPRLALSYISNRMLHSFIYSQKNRRHSYTDNKTSDPQDMADILLGRQGTTAARHSPNTTSPSLIYQPKTIELAYTNNKTHHSHILTKNHLTFPYTRRIWRTSCWDVKARPWRCCSSGQTFHIRSAPACAARSPTGPIRR